MSDQKTKRKKKKKTKQSNGSGSVIQREDGLWMARVTVGRDSKGKLIRRTVYGKGEQEARNKMIAIQNDVISGTYINPSNVKVCEWINIWLIEYIKTSVRPSTYVSYEMNMRLHVVDIIGEKRLKDLKSEDLQRMYNTLRKSGNSSDGGSLSAKTIRNIHNALHKCLEQAVANGHILRNPANAEGVALPKREVITRRVLTLQEQQNLLKFIEGERLEVAFRLALATGVRMGELLALKWEDVDLDKGIINIRQSLSRIKTFEENSKTKTRLIFHEPKTGSSIRAIPLIPQIVEDLKVHKSKQEEEINVNDSSFNRLNLVFISEVGTPIEPRSFIRKFHQIIEKAGLDHANVHSMRHTFATRLLEVKEEPKVVQELLGHSDISTTLNIYSHVLPEIKSRATVKLSHLFGREIPASNNKEDTKEHTGDIQDI